MKIEAGKYYRTRGGERVGPAKRELAHEYAGKGFVWRVGGYTYTEEGACGWEPDDDDIVAEWVAPTPDTPTAPDNPCIKAITRREVVPGELIFDRGACLRITEVAGRGVPHVIINRYAFTATALREAATAFNEIADALDENKKADA